MRYRSIILAAGILLLTSSGVAQERTVLTKPLPAPVPVPAIADYTPAELRLVLAPASAITVVLVATDGTALTFDYPCSTGCAYDTEAKVRTLIGTLNTINLSTRSLWRRVFDRLVADFPERFPGGAVVQ